MKVQSFCFEGPLIMQPKVYIAACFCKTSFEAKESENLG